MRGAFVVPTSILGMMGLTLCVQLGAQDSRDFFPIDPVPVELLIGAPMVSDGGGEAELTGAGSNTFPVLKPQHRDPRQTTLAEKCIEDRTGVIVASGIIGGIFGYFASVGLERWTGGGGAPHWQIALVSAGVNAAGAAVYCALVPVLERDPPPAVREAARDGGGVLDRGWVWSDGAF